MVDGFPQLEWSAARVHFVGIGGIGMSALARIAAAKGAVVSGCDGAEGTILAELRSSGFTCHVGHSPAHLDDIDVVVYSSAVPLETPELQTALTRGIRVVSRGRMLAWLQRGHDTVAVAGAHGKTTTTWIIANMLIRCGADPTVAVGGNVAELNGNSRVGGRIFVTEADESDGSFLHLVPKYPVITNIDRDHLDYYSGIREIKQAFAHFADKTGDVDGAVIACADCPNVRSILKRIGGRKITYGIERGDVAAENVRLQPGRAVYDARLSGGAVKDVVLSLPGAHNVRNSLAALALAMDLGLPMDGVLEALADTSHVDRRLQNRGSRHGITVYDDYAHHPAEISATLEAARMLADRSQGGRLVGVFQPHRYSRTLHLQKEFGPVFDRLDLLLIAPIYAASEPPIDGVSSELVARHVKAHGNVKFELVPDLKQVPGRLSAELAPGDTVIIIGAGDVWQVGDALFEAMKQAAPAPGQAEAAGG